MSQEPGAVPPSGLQVQAAPASAGRNVASLADIAGEWDIVSFDDHSPPRLNGSGKRHAFVDIGPEEMRFAIGCNYSGMTGRVRAGVLHAEPGDGIQTVMGCGPEREARDERFFGFFRSRPQVALLPGGRVRMFTPGHELLLERASVRRLLMGPALREILGSWRVVRFTHIPAGQSWGPMYSPGRVIIEEGRLGYSRCPGRTARFTYTPDFLLRRDSASATKAPAGCLGATPPPTEVEPMLAELLEQSPEVERVPGGHFVLRSRQYSVLLASEADYQRQFGDQASEWEKRPG